VISGTIPLSLDAIELTDAVKSDLEWLQKFREPWDRVKEKWAATSKYRMYDLAKSHGTVADYTTKFKQLQQKNGHELVSTGGFLKLSNWSFKILFIAISVALSRKAQHCKFLRLDFQL